MTGYLSRLVERAAPPPTMPGPRALHDPFETVAPLEPATPAPEMAATTIPPETPTPIALAPAPAQLIAPAVTVVATSPAPPLQPPPSPDPPPIAARETPPTINLQPAPPVPRPLEMSASPAPDVPMPAPRDARQAADAFMAQVLSPRHVGLETVLPAPPSAGQVSAPLRADERTEPESPPPQLLAPPAPAQMLEPAETPAAPPPVPVPTPELMIGHLTVEVHPKAPRPETRIIRQMVSTPPEGRTMAPRATRARFGLGQM